MEKKKEKEEAELGPGGNKEKKGLVRSRFVFKKKCFSNKFYYYLSVYPISICAISILMTYLAGKIRCQQY